MKQKIIDDNEVVTRGILREVLKEELSNYPTKIQLEIKLDNLEKRIDDKARGYRDEILTKMDQILGELAQIREDNHFRDRDIRELKKTDRDHEKRIKKIEKRQIN